MVVDGCLVLTPARRPPAPPNRAGTAGGGGHQGLKEAWVASLIQASSLWRARRFPQRMLSVSGLRTSSGSGILLIVIRKTPRGSNPNEARAPTHGRAPARGMTPAWGGRQGMDSRTRRHIPRRGWALRCRSRRTRVSDDFAKHVIETLSDRAGNRWSNAGFRKVAGDPRIGPTEAAMLALPPTAWLRCNTVPAPTQLSLLRNASIPILVSSSARSVPSWWTSVLPCQGCGGSVHTCGRRPRRAAAWRWGTP